MRDFDQEGLLQETRTMAWGQMSAAVELNSFKERMFKAILQRLKIIIPPPATLLDVGCSFGGFLLKARTAGYVVAGTDLVPEAVAYVHSQGIEAQVVASVQSYNAIPPRKFDIITCLDCSYYWENQLEEYTRIFERLRPGGVLVVRAADKSWMVSLAKFVRPLSKKISQKILREVVSDHLCSTPAKSTLRVLRDIGFEIIEASPRGALHSDNTRPIVKTMFGVGIFLYAMTGAFVAPGILIIARKPGRIINDS